MIPRALALLLLAPLAAQAQLVLFTASGARVGSSLNLGEVAAGAPKDFSFRAANTSGSSVPLTAAIAGSGFTIVSPLSFPVQVGPGSSQDLVVHFAGGPPSSYSANLQVGNTSVLLVVTSVYVPILTAGTGCSGPDTNSIVAFGNVTAGQTAVCTLSLQNLNPQAVLVSLVAVSGTGFSLSKPVNTPLTLAPGESVNFAIAYAPAVPEIDAGSLTVAPLSFSLTGTAVSPLLPKPILQFDAGPPASGQNRTVTMQLPSPSPVAASGSVNLSFTPDSNLPIDPAIQFTANGSRSIPFTIQPGDTNIKLGGQPGATFQTGTTAGTITFTVTANVPLAGDPTTTFVIPPSIVSIHNPSAVARAGALDVQVFSAFDNTYSAGRMSFTFYDVNGTMIQPALVQADFTNRFNSYFASLGGGSDFQMLVTFPVTGQANRIGSVDFSMTNAAGATPTQHLSVINDTGQCIAIGTSEILCPQTPP